MHRKNSSTPETNLTHRLHERNNTGLLRKLTVAENLVDFCSNDYLGFARSDDLKKRIIEEIGRLKTHEKNLFGSTGSRLISGNSKYVEELEYFIADYHLAESGLIFNSGYDANIGLLSSVPKRGDLIFYDELSHASIRDGIRLSLATSYSFRHNDLKHLNELINTQSVRIRNGNIFVAVESVYSMDGDFAPLKELSELCKMFYAYLIVDEAHAVGIYGRGGRGRVVELGLEEMTFARIITFGKALGAFGAIVLCSPVVKEYLINFARTFIYTTGLPLAALIAIRNAYIYLSESESKIVKVKHLADRFQHQITTIPDKEKLFHKNKSPIQIMSCPGNENARNLAAKARQNQFDVRAILSPTVPKGKERLRICLHEFNTEDEISMLINCLTT